jgi:hypothetical protein
VIRNPAEFVETLSRTPPATIDPVLKRNVERRAINACLPTRNYFHLAWRRV